MPIIIAQNIHRTFGKEPLLTHVLRGVDITVEPGEFVAIMGKSGAGKSTFMYQLSVLDTPSSGHLIVDGTDVMSLSDGEQQRVAIARAIASAPKIIFADEPTANLDSISSKQVIDLLSDLNHTTGQTIVMVTHEREYALGANRILYMEDGVIVQEEKLRPVHN